MPRASQQRAWFGIFPSCFITPVSMSIHMVNSACRNWPLRAAGIGWVISEAEKYPAYSTIKKYIPGAFPRGEPIKLPMPDPRDQIYVGWYDPPADADTRIEWKVEKSAEPDE